jgi:ElaB/YqjD/DUF883 family membrane-anchored ribosome-binding protein
MTQQRTEYPLDYTKGPTSNDRLSEDGEKTMGRVKAAAADAQEYAGQLAEQAREYGEKAQEAARQFKPFVEKSMKEQPMATLALAAVVGVVLGVLWKK